MTKGVSRDCSAKLQAKLAEVLERELQLFAHVLDPLEISEIMFEAAVMVVRTTAATLAGYATKPEDVETIFRSVTVGIQASVESGEADGIARTKAQLAARGNRG